jgi:hypothetical protein
MRELAQKLLEGSQLQHGPRATGAVLLNERLQLSLVRFAGVDGFASLLRRAVAMTSAKIPALRNVEVGADGRIEGLDPGFAQDHVLWQAAAIAVTVQLLDLLVVFIGESFTRRMVHEACDEPSSNE